MILYERGTVKKNVKFVRMTSIVTCIGIVSYERNKSKTDNVYIIVRKTTFLYCMRNLYAYNVAHS